MEKDERMQKFIQTSSVWIDLANMDYCLYDRQEIVAISIYYAPLKLLRPDAYRAKGGDDEK